MISPWDPPHRLQDFARRDYDKLLRAQMKGSFRNFGALAQSVMTNGVAGQAFRMAKADIGISFEWRT